MVDDKDNFVVDEELGKGAVLDLALDNQCIAKNFRRVAQLCWSAARDVMEPLLVAEMRAWSLRNKGATVKPFLSQLFDSLPSTMPDWIEHSKFNVRGGFTKGNFITRDIENDVDFVRQAFANHDLRNCMLSPSTVKCPDFEAVMEEQPKDFWFLSVSSKLYSETYDDTLGSNFRSTMPDIFFMKKDGSANQQCRRLRKSWTMLLGEKKDCFSRNLRIHLCLPEVKSPRSDQERIFTHGNSVVAYITAENVHKIFRTDIISTLKNIGCLAEK